jgi:hypothetical protein
MQKPSGNTSSMITFASIICSRAPRATQAGSTRKRSENSAAVSSSTSGWKKRSCSPAVRAPHHGETLSIAAELRLQHGAIAALLVPSPCSAVVNALKAVLAKHHALEEGPDGVYARCDRIVSPEVVALLGRLQAAAEVPPAAHVDGDKVEASARRALTRAGFDSNLLSD